MPFTPRLQAPETYEKLYAYDRLLSKDDVQPYLFNLQNQGVTWNTSCSEIKYIFNFEIL